MSETALPKDEAQPALQAPVESTVTAPRRGNGLAVVALLLGVAGVAAGGWGIWQVRALQASGQQQTGQVQALDDQSQSSSRTSSNWPRVWPSCQLRTSWKSAVAW